MPLAQALQEEQDRTDTVYSNISTSSSLPLTTDQSRQSEENIYEELTGLSTTPPSQMNLTPVPDVQVPTGRLWSERDTSSNDTSQLQSQRRRLEE